VSAQDGPGGHVTYRRQYRRCGKPGCSRCAAGGRGHGPYWYATWWEEGRQRSRYLGKDAPAVASVACGADAPPVAPTVAPLRVQTLGGFAVWRGAQQVPAEAWSGRHAVALFQCLLSTPGHRLAREQAIEALWPEADPEAGAHRLRTTIHRLRRALDLPGATARYLRTEGDILALAPPGDALPDGEWLDATAFAQAARAALAGQDAAACRAALVRYTGEYLPDQPNTEWATAPRATLRRHYLDLLLHLATLSGARGTLDEAEDCLRRVLAADPAHEAAAATLMGLLGQSGRRDEALRVYQALTTALDQELDVTPGIEVAALRARLLTQHKAPRAAPAPPAAEGSRQAHPTNLPVALTSFVGRAWEVADITAALRTARLVTLTGPGGGGKTRLALAVAERLVQVYAGGVWLVEFAALADAAVVPQAVLAALGMAEQPGHAVRDTLVAALRPRHLLLLLDNCEHLVDACAALAAVLLRACPHLRVLATSRTPLGVEGERTTMVLPLAAPDPEHLPPLDQVATYEAVQLFIQRAQARRPGLTLSAENVSAVAQICARLDGLPLAIELAAARAALLPLAGIATRLDDRFGLLTGGPRTALPRQQTLRATLDWSYQLLTPDEQSLLARLAVFAGGCTLEAAAAVCGAPEARESIMLEGLSSLVNKGLLQPAAGADEAPRFAMLETIRAYSQERLAESGAAQTVLGRHAAYYLALAEQVETHHWGPQQRLWLARVEADHDNIRAALRWLRDGDDAEFRLRLAFAMWRPWMLRSHLREGSRWLEEVLAREGGPPLLRAKVLYGAGVLRYRRCDYAHSRNLQEQSMALFRASGDRWGMARTLNQLANVALNAAANGQARALYGESLQLARAIRDTWMEATVLNNLGLVALYEHDYAAAQAVYEASLVLRRQGGDPWAIAESLTGLGRVLVQQDDARRATILLQESVALLRDVGDNRALADSLEALAAATGLQGQPERAARLWAAAETLRGASGAPLDQFDRTRNERWLAAVRAGVDEAAWRAAWQEGRTMPLEEAIAEALREGAQPARC
jgi:predicted ATPase/DNA-binding SARP family transcriptional activator